ncbi:BamA/TamA family outer membrane protein, partial [bacterium]|nr:BamA/TamA family outer membrane protein [bacterium]
NRIGMPRKIRDELLLAPCDSSRIDRSLFNLKNIFAQHGYWDFKIVSKDLVPHKKTGDRTLKLIVDPGIKRILDSVVVEKKSSSRHPMIPSFHERMIPFDPEIIADHNSLIISTLQQQGYWYPTLTASLVTTASDKKTETIKLVWLLDPREYVKFGKLIVRGSSKLSFDTILRHTNIKPGRACTHSEISAAQKKLKGLGVFKTVQLVPDDFSKRAHIKDIIAHVVDDSPYELRLRLGIFISQTQKPILESSYIKAGGSIIAKNPFNMADKLSLSADISRIEHSARAEYHIPSFPFRWASGYVMTEAFYKNKPTSTGSGNSHYRSRSERMAVGLESDRQDHHFDLCSGISHLRVSDVFGDINLDDRLIDVPLHTFANHFSWKHGKKYLEGQEPGQTSKAMLSAHFPINLIQPHQSILKMTCEHSRAISLGRDLLCMLSMRAGHIVESAITGIIPQERFFLGGANSVRGYEKDTLPPLGTSTTVSADGTETIDYTIQGGRSMLNCSAELIRRFHKSASWVAFTDLGALSQTGLQEMRDNARVTIGCGVRLHTPVGDVRFDIGLKTKKSYSDEGRYAWHLGFGGHF